MWGHDSQGKARAWGWSGTRGQSQKPQLGTPGPRTDLPKAELEMWDSNLKPGPAAATVRHPWVAAEPAGTRLLAVLLTRPHAPAHVCSPEKGKALDPGGRGSWLKTESLEEQVLLASPLARE